MKENKKIRKEQGNSRKEIFEWIIILFIVATAAFILDTQIVVNANIPSGSMKNTIMPGDRIMGSRLAYRNTDPERFDIIIFRFPDDKENVYIKRIIGLPNETVTIVDGKIYINNSKEALCDTYSLEPMTGSFGPYIIPDGNYFVMGDNRNNSFDSHTRIACRLCAPLYMARKNGGRVFLRSLRFPGFSDTLCGSLNND